MTPIILFDEAPTPPSFIAWAVRRSLPVLPADEANAEIVRLNVEIKRLEAQLDAREISYGK